MLKLENINITFNKNTANERKALQHIDLDVADGDFVTVIGSNGAGKSTLMNSPKGASTCKNYRQAFPRPAERNCAKHDHRGKSRPCLQSWKASFADYRYQEKGRFSVQRKAQGA